MLKRILFFFVFLFFLNQSVYSKDIKSYDFHYNFLESIVNLEIWDSNEEKEMWEKCLINFSTIFPQLETLTLPNPSNPKKMQNNQNEFFEVYSSKEGALALAEKIMPILMELEGAEKIIPPEFEKIELEYFNFFANTMVAIIYSIETC